MIRIRWNVIESASLPEYQRLHSKALIFERSSAPRFVLAFIHQLGTEVTFEVVGVVMASRCHAYVARGHVRNR
ncbi:hypothetical protein Cni_G10536 [Canna indica]|uniref:Uncharacterized protein n=1 Tax=Canna indica TaxID=4628 RepID=A0AAQ3K5Y0_9LILI|nr:hypothetical protein Cni_G10536 [Canna indica]